MGSRAGPRKQCSFQSLQADNTKAYWSAHKAFYETSVREPMAALLDELSGEFGPGRIARPDRIYGSGPISRTRPLRAARRLQSAARRAPRCGHGAGRWGSADWANRY